jgi:hypothetical protein
MLSGFTALTSGRRMLGLFSNKTEHPLADPSEAKRILAEIAGRDALGAIEEASGWIESIGGTTGFKPAQRLDLMLKLDEATVCHRRGAWRATTRPGAASRAQESRHWELGHGYWKQLLTAYLDCLHRLIARARRMPMRSNRSSTCSMAGWPTPWRPI